MKIEKSKKLLGGKKKLSVLVVDDEESARKLFTSFLKRRYKVHQAGSASEAMALIEKDPPDIVITDIRMPGDDGLVLLSRIKEGNSYFCYKRRSF